MYCVFIWFNILIWFNDFFVWLLRLSRATSCKGSILLYRLVVWQSHAALNNRICTYLIYVYLIFISLMWQCGIIIDSIMRYIMPTTALAIRSETHIDPDSMMGSRGWGVGQWRSCALAHVTYATLIITGTQKLDGPLFQDPRSRIQLTESWEFP